MLIFIWQGKRTCHVSEAKKKSPNLNWKFSFCVTPAKILFRGPPSTCFKKQAERRLPRWLKEWSPSPARKASPFQPKHSVIFCFFLNCFCMSYSNIFHVWILNKSLNKQHICLVKIYIYMCSFRMVYKRISSCLLAEFCRTFLNVTVSYSTKYKEKSDFVENQAKEDRPPV